MVYYITHGKVRYMSVQNDQLLNKIVEHARQVGSKKNYPLTAERYLVALVDVLDGSYPLEGADLEAVQKIFRDIGVDVHRLKRLLLGHIEGGRSMVYLDDLYMKKKMSEAQQKAAAAAQPYLTAEVLLRCILEDPTDAIRDSVKEAVASASKPADSGNGAPADNADPFRTIMANFRAEQKPQDGAPINIGGAPKPEGGQPADDKPKAPKKAEPAQKNIVEQLTEETKELQKKLAEVIVGQDNAINVVASGYFQHKLLALTDRKRERPSATFLFAGPPGVGKTFLAETFAKNLGLPFSRFDMSEYSDNEANVEFAGSPKIYKDSKPGNVTNFVATNPRCVLLFDEIEKAHINVIHLFLQILDAGRLRDSHTNDEVSFKDAIMIFTTNAGKNLYEDSDTGDFSALSRKVILKALQKDVNPTTGVPFFPAAICSRFATGNVVMFNHMAAHSLCQIAKREIRRQADNFGTEIGIDIDIEEQVYSALLFAEGGAADARTVRSRAETFFNNELYELFRLVSAASNTGSLSQIDKIHISVDLPEGNPELMDMFVGRTEPDVLVFSSAEVGALCASKTDRCKFHTASTVDAAKEILGKKDIKVVLLDPNFGGKGEAKGYLNIEDMDSVSRDFFHYLREKEGSLPTFLLQTEERTYGMEEKVSYLRQGMRGVITVTAGDDDFADEINLICSNLHQQLSMNKLAKANKLVNFETAQTLNEAGNVAYIRLFDFEMAVALDPEDSGSILSSVSKPNVRFDQVIGADDAKKELQYFVEYLKNPKKFLESGASAPKGVLLYGPPGTGKTLLAKAMASESDVTFITAEGNQFLKKYVGEGPEKVHELFRTARKYAPSIVFIDEIDAIAKERNGGNDGSSQVSSATLTALLTEMDGFKKDATKPVFVLAATNFDVEPGSPKSLDAALMRRFDRRVLIDLPNKNDRVRYLKMKLAEHVAFDVSDAKIDSIAVRATGMSLASLESVVELALRSVLRQGNGKVDDEVFDEAFELFNSGEKKQWDPRELERTARHEAGHAFLYWKSGNCPSYVTVVARGNHGGYMQHGDTEQKGSYSRQDLLDLIRTSLAGRAAEIVYYGPEGGMTTGASGDLASATRRARNMICRYGMSEQFGLAVIDEDIARGGELADEVRAAVNEILARELENTIALIEANRAAVDALVEALLTKNHLSGDEIDAIFSAHATK
ncbi:MAG: AAA family ATPase [Ruminococcaceae bacterium]|nr:AAA family ATPase [Oscillospiraceae bacterium]